MRVLAIDTAFGVLACAAALGDRVVALRHGALGSKAAEHLPGLVAQTLAEPGWRIADLDRIAVTLGPGGFTSLRAGLAFAKGLALASGKPLLGFTTLEALAVSAPHGATPIAAVIDAKRDEVFLQIFGPDRSPLGAPMVVPVSHLDRAFDWPVRIRVCGSGSAILTSQISGHSESLAFDVPDAAALAVHCQAFAPSERPADAVYLRPADARPMA